MNTDETGPERVRAPNPVKAENDGRIDTHIQMVALGDDFGRRLVARKGSVPKGTFSD